MRRPDIVTARVGRGEHRVRVMSLREREFDMQVSGSSEQLTRTTVTFISSRDEVAKLSSFVRNVVPEPGMLDPHFFLASVPQNRWRPCVLVVSQGQRTMGLLYCRERMLAGVGTRLAEGDDTLDTMIVASPLEKELVMRSGVEALLKNMIGVRFLVASDRLAILKGFRGAANLEFGRYGCSAHLQLPGTYDEFLRKAGRAIRHNFRRYQRRSEQAGNQFSSELAFSDFSAAARHVLPNAAYAKPQRILETHLAMVEAMPSRMLVGLRNSRGEWISLAAGWHLGNQTTMIFQLNDRTRLRESLSITLRSYLIEALINRGCRELVFLGGTSAPLSSLCIMRDQFRTYIDAPTLPWLLFRSICKMFSKLIAPRTSNQLEWIVPGPPTSTR
jgi:hypothetical protein